jgi:glycosyltransferase involved in cell wall biosynthesis
VTFHLTAFPHTQTTKDYFTCAYTQKAFKISKMLTQRGHKVILYSGEQNEAVCTEHVPCLTEAERYGWFGANDQSQMPEISWDAGEVYWRVYVGRMITEISKRLNKGDFILLGTSWPLEPLYLMFKNDARVVEHGVGYEGIFGYDDVYCAFESYAWQHYVYGSRKIVNGRNFDCVIPNYFDPEDFPNVNDGKGDYLLFMGRVTPRKGIDECVEIAKASGMKLVIAGPSKATRTQDAVDLTKANVELVGPANANLRSLLMSKARALLIPTRYIEPFGGVAVEAMMSGCPVIGSDWGAMTETIAPGLNGFRCRTLKEYVAAVEAVGALKPEEIRKDAMDHYSLEAVAPQYEAWFNRLQTLWDKGWYQV